MPLQPQKLPLPFQTGLSQKTDARWLDVGAQTTVTNGVFRKVGAIQKRQGYTALSQQTLPDVGSIASCKALGHRFDQLTLIDGTNYYGYSSTAAKWVSEDLVPNVDAWRDGVAEWPTGMTSFDTAYGAGYLVIAWTAKASAAGNNGIYCSIIDWTTGTYHLQNYAVPIGAAVVSYVRVVISGSTVMLLGVNDGTTNVIGVTVSLTTMAVATAITNVLTDFDTTAHASMWDVCPVANGTGAAIVYPYASGPTRQTKLALIPTTLTVATSTTFAPPSTMASPGFGYAICADANDNLWFAVGYQNGGGNTQFHVGARNPSTLALVLAETSMWTTTGTTRERCGIAKLSATSCVLIASNATNNVGMKWGQITTAATVSGTARTLYYHQVGAKPFVQGGKAYVTAIAYPTLNAYVGSPPVNTSSPQGAHVLVDLDVAHTDGTQQAGRPVAYVGPRVTNVTNVSFTTNPVAVQTCQVDSSTWITVGSFSGALAGRYKLDAITYSYLPSYQHVELGDSVYISGGVLSQFDGKAVTEVGFLHPPHSFGASVSAGGAVDSGAHTYLAVYQWTDGAGQVQRSAAAITSATTSAGSNTVTLTIGNCFQTRKQDYENGFAPPISIQLYRTAVGGSVFYQMLSDTAMLTSTPNTFSQNYVDTMSDAALAALGYGIWPGQGGVLEGYAPPGLLYLASHGQRLFGVADDRVTLWYTNEVEIGEQPKFSDSQRLVMPTGPITGLASLDQILYVFTSGLIFAVDGRGPNVFGQQSDYNVRRVPSEVGAVHQRSIVVTSQGVYFQSAQGIYMLTRGGEVQYVGAAIETTLASYPYVVSATTVPNMGEVRFALATSSASAVGVTAVYNYVLQAWSVFDRYDTGTSTQTVSSASETYCGGRYYWATSGGLVYQENTSSTATNALTDNGHWVTLTVESAWAKADGISGWGRFWYAYVTSEMVSPHDMTISIAQDYSPSYSQTHTFTASEMAGWTTPLRESDIHIGTQKASAIRVKINDSAPTGVASTTGAGPNLVGLTIEVGVYQHGKRLPPSQGA